MEDGILEPGRKALKSPGTGHTLQDLAAIAIRAGNPQKLPFI
jgi:hypothetical protein